MRSGRLLCIFLIAIACLAHAQSNPVPLINRPIATNDRALAGWLQPASPTQGSVIQNYGKIPLAFEPNQGQTDAEVKFLSRGNGYTLFLTGDEAVFSLRGNESGTDAGPSAHRITAADSPGQQNTNLSTTDGVLRMKLRHANHAAKVAGEDELPGKSNYFLGNDPKKWRTNVPEYARVKYEGIYSGIDLVYYGNQRQLEYDFIVAPGIDPHQIQFDVRGSKNIQRDKDGDLVLQMADREVRWGKPLVYQEKGGTRREIAAHYVIKDKTRIGFQVADYDVRMPLFIDPLVYSTYLGGSSEDGGYGIAVDRSGNAYVTGHTSSTNFPTVNPLQATLHGSNDVFVAKLNLTGSALIYSTYLGGSLDDYGNAIAVDGSGNAYVTGNTSSTDFPTVNPIQPAMAGVYDAFVAKLNPTGSALVYSTYLGGSEADAGNGIAVDSSGNAYIAGFTWSTNFPTAHPFQTTLGGTINAFVTKLNPAGSALVYSTYLGGSGEDGGGAIAVDSSDDAYVTGNTTSTNFPTSNPFQPALAGDNDVFVTKVNPTGSALVYSTYLGGSHDDIGFGIAVGSSGNAYITGYTESSNFPTVNALFPNGCEFVEAFVTQFNSAGSALVYSTYLPGDHGYGIAVDSPGNAYVTGDAGSGFPTVNAVQPTFGGGNSDAYISEINPAGSAFVFSTYLGGAGDDYGQGVTVDSFGNVHVTGYTASTNFPSVHPLQATYGGGDYDAFVAKIGNPPSGPDLTVFKTHSGNFAQGQIGATYTITVSNFGSSSTSGVVTLVDTLPASLTATAMAGGGWTCDLATLTCTRSDVLDAGSSYPVITLTVNVAGNAPPSVVNTATVSGGGSTYDNNTANDPTIVNGPPQAISATPAAATGTNVTFSLVYSAENGTQYTDLSWAEVLFNTSLTGLNGCYVVYLQSRKSFYLENEAGTEWLGPLTPGSAGTLANNQCTVNGAGTTVSGSGQTLTLNLPLAAASGFIGTKNTYMWVSENDGSSSGWQTLGTWTPAADTPPTADSVTPRAATGTNVTFALVYSSHNGKGYTDLGWAEALFNTTLTGLGGCYVAYYQPANALYLENEAGTGWLGPLTPPSLGSLSNSQCTVNGATTTALGSGETLTLSLSLSAGGGFIGTENTYMWVNDIDGTSSANGWQLNGTWAP